MIKIPPEVFIPAVRTFATHIAKNDLRRQIHRKAGS
jgi:hypothetical protein